ncbi:hypothetical protein B0T20DRAFT_243411 [Sordaria brevicollis]|uniref:Uncharacterized protein n=1 Tax=Sordaria brevicollis TaxID=83679 RepID=A0AAE0UAV0_SORBR|nr:hypothetical protein B0T20DRAFT_243411 [Sordaria brevicollis]
MPHFFFLFFLFIIIFFFSFFLLSCENSVHMFSPYPSNNTAPSHLLLFRMQNIRNVQPTYRSGPSNSRNSIKHSPDQMETSWCLLQIKF